MPVNLRDKLSKSLRKLVWSKESWCKSFVNVCVCQSFFFAFLDLTPHHSLLSSFHQTWFRFLISDLFFPFTVVTRFEDSKAFRQCSYLRGHYIYIYISYIKAIDRLNTRIKRKKNPPNSKRMCLRIRSVNVENKRFDCTLVVIVVVIVVFLDRKRRRLRRSSIAPKRRVARESWYIFFFVTHINRHLARNVQ